MFGWKLPWKIEKYDFEKFEMSNYEVLLPDKDSRYPQKGRSGSF